MVTDYIKQVSQQTAIQSQIDQVQSQLDLIQSRMSSQYPAATESAKLKAEVEKAALQYKNVGDNPEVSKIIMDLAWENGVTSVIIRPATVYGELDGASINLLVYCNN